MGMCMGKNGAMCKVKVVRTDGFKMQIELCETPEEMEKITVLQLKEKIAERLPEDQRNGESKNLRLIFKDKTLDEDSKSLSEYGIQHKSVIHMSPEEESPESQTDGLKKDDKDKHKKQGSMEKLADLNKKKCIIQ